MFDQPPIHVDDVKGAVGSVGERDRAEALVGRGDELGAWVRLGRAQRRAVIPQRDPADKVRSGIGDEHVAVQFVWEAVAAIDDGAADGGVSGQGAISRSDARLIAAVQTRCRPHRPDGIQSLSGVASRS